MDPNATLARIRELLPRMADVLNPDDDGPDREAWELVDHVESLDRWLSRGGFLPNAWRQKHPSIAAVAAARQHLDAAARELGQALGPRS